MTRGGLAPTSGGQAIEIVGGQILEPNNERQLVFPKQNL